MTGRTHITASVAIAMMIASFLGSSNGAQAGTCGQGVFCAGAAGADITPPVTTPMWGYTARTGLPLLGSGLDPASDLADGGTKLASGDVSGAEASVRVATNEQIVHDKLNSDPDRYDKTFVSNHGIHLRLFANAFVLQDPNGAKVAVVQVDLGGLPGEVHQAVADKLAADGVGVDRDRLLISATHTHQGPGGIFQYQGYALLGGDEFDPRVFYAVVTGIANAVERANARLQPATLAWGQIPTTDANRNRRVSNQWCMNPENKCVEVAGKRLPTAESPPANDPVLTMIRLDTTEGLPIGVITNFAAHGTIGGDDNLLFSGDNQGWATRLVAAAIAEEYGQALPDGWEIVDALVNGAQGDMSPIGGTNGYDYGGTQREYAQMEDAGLRQMRPAIELWRSLDNGRTDITLDARFEFLCFCGQAVDHPYDGAAIDKTDPMWDHIAAYASLGYGGVTGPDGSSIPVAMPAQGHKQPTLIGSQTNPSIVRLQVMRIADLLLASIPGEPTITTGRRIMQRLRELPGHEGLYKDVIIAGLADDYDSYFATPEEYTAYQYEGGFTLFGPQSQPLLSDELATLTTRMIARQSMPDCSVTANDPAFCALHPEHPNTSALQSPPSPVNVDPTPKIVGQPQRNVARFEVAEFSWTGGSPSAEWRLDQDRVRIQQLTGTGWTTVAGDAHDAWTVLRYDKVNGAHQWTAQWDLTRDIAPGTYRFHILGAFGTAPGTRTPYTIDSIAFAVAPSGALSVQSAPGGPNMLKVWAGSPAPDQARSFRIRPTLVPDGFITVQVERGGVPAAIETDVDPAGVTFVALEPGDIVTHVDVQDAFGNRGGN